MRALATAVLAILCATASAQTLVNEPSAAQRCLHHKGGAGAQPAYPDELFNRNRGGRVHVQLAFSTAASPPDVEVLLHEGDQALLDSVLAHLQGLRVPCLPAGAPPAKLRQDFVFAPDKRRVHWSRAEDAAPTADQPRPWDCLTREGGGANPGYPDSARREGVAGRVLLRLSFDTPTAEPRIESFSRRSARKLAEHSREWARGYRMPCLRDPRSTMIEFTYSFEQESYGFRQITLLQLMGITRGIREQTLAFNTAEMGCPFELRFQYLRPQLDNAVGEPGDRVPARRPLLEWLEKIELDLTSLALDSVWGAEARVAVPCVNIDLKPKEK